MHVQSYPVDVTTAADGTVTAYSPQLNGLLSQIRYVKDGSNAYDNTVDVTITSEDTGENLWVEQNVTASKTVAPRQATHGTDGVAALYAAGGVAVNDMIAISGRAKIVLAQGGNAKTGRFWFLTI